MDSQPLPFYLHGLASDGQSLWCSTKRGLIHRLGAELNVEETYLTSFEIEDLAYHDGDLWVIEKDANRVHRFARTSPTDNVKVTNPITTGSSSKADTSLDRLENSHDVKTPATDRQLAASPASVQQKLIEYRGKFQNGSLDPTDEIETSAFLEFLRMHGDQIDYRTLLEMPELTEVVDRGEFELLLESQLAKSSPVISQTIWVKMPGIDRWEHRQRNRETTEQLLLSRASQDMSPSFLSVSPSVDLQTTEFTVIWQKNSMDKRVELELSRNQLDVLIQQRKGSLGLIALESYPLNGEKKYAALWSSRYPEFELHERLDRRSLLSLKTDLKSKRLYPIYVNDHEDGRLTTIWAQTDLEFELLLNQTYFDLKQLEQKNPDAQLPICLDSWFDGKRRRYSVVMAQLKHAFEWKFSVLVPDSEFQATFDRLNKPGWSTLSTTESILSPHLPVPN